MAKGINKCTFIGNVTKDAELRSTPSGSVVNMTLACTEQWRDKDSRETREATEFVPIVLFNGLADTAGKYIKMGQQVYVECQYRLRKWKDNEGKDRYTPEFVAKEMQMLGGRPQGQSQEQQAPQQQSQQRQAPPANQQRQQSSQSQQRQPQGQGQQQASQQRQQPQQQRSAPAPQQRQPEPAGDGYGDGFGTGFGDGGPDDIPF